MTRALTVSALVVCALAGCVDRRVSTAGDDRDALRWSGDTLHIEAQLVRASDDSAARGDVVVRPTGVRHIGGALYVPDISVDRIAVLDTAGRVRRWIGARGRGPGELLGVSHVAVFGDRVFVGDALNGRVSEFTAAGAFVQTHAVPFAAGSVAAGAGGVITGARAQRHYAARVRGARAPDLVLRRPRTPVVSAMQRWTMMPGHDLVVADSTGFIVLDQASLQLCRYRTTRADAHCRSLPHALVRRLVAYRNARVTALEAATGLRVNAAEVAKDMIMIGDTLAVLLTLPEMPIALIHVADGSLTPAIIDPTELAPWARGATGFAWDGRAFVVVGDDGIGRLHLAPRASPSPGN